MLLTRNLLLGLGGATSNGTVPPSKVPVVMESPLVQPPPSLVHPAAGPVTAQELRVIQQMNDAVVPPGANGTET